MKELTLSGKAGLIKQARLFVVRPPEKSQLIQVPGVQFKPEKISVTEVIDELESNIIHYQGRAAEYEMDLRELMGNPDSLQKMLDKYVGEVGES